MSRVSAGVSCSIEQALPQIGHSKVCTSGRVHVLGNIRRRNIASAHTSQVGAGARTLLTHVQGTADADKQRDKSDHNKYERDFGFGHVGVLQRITASDAAKLQ
jgi:hypothetical protein